MFVKKLVLKIRFFLQKNAKFINKFFVYMALATLFYISINSLIMERFILEKARTDEMLGKHKNAIVYYNIAYLYYKNNHYSETNKEIFFALPYQKALCHLKTKNLKKSIQSMLDGLTTIQTEYGILSDESAFFTKKYLFTYYLEMDKQALAVQEFNNLMSIYKKIGYGEKEKADMLILSGDLYYKQKKYEKAINAYEQAYNYLIKQRTIDYDSFSKIATRISEYSFEHNQKELAIEIYKRSIEALKNADKKQNKYRVDLLIKLGNLCKIEDKNLKDSIACYEEAIELIKTLPRACAFRQNISEYLNILKDLYKKDNQYIKSANIEKELIKRRRFSFFY